MARGSCLYCGAALSAEVLEAAARAAERVLQTGNLVNLEALARGQERETPPRRYVVVETTVVSAEVLADACSISLWEARQWRAASRYRLLKITSEPLPGVLETRLQAQGLNAQSLSEDLVARARKPISLDSIDLRANPLQCSLRDDPELPLATRALEEQDLILVVSASIKQEKVNENTTRLRSDRRIEDAWLVHLHFKNDTRPWEIDPRRTGYQGPGLASAHMRTVELVRRLSVRISHDEGFKNLVPALSPAPAVEDLKALGNERKRSGKDKTILVHNNAAQFREYSAWRAAIERAMGSS